VEEGSVSGEPVKAAVCRPLCTSIPSQLEASSPHHLEEVGGLRYIIPSHELTLLRFGDVGSVCGSCLGVGLSCGVRGRSAEALFLNGLELIRAQ